MRWKSSCWTISWGCRTPHFPPYRSCSDICTHIKNNSQSFKLEASARPARPKSILVLALHVRREPPQSPTPNTTPPPPSLTPAQTTPNPSHQSRPAAVPDTPSRSPPTSQTCHSRSRALRDHTARQHAGHSRRQSHPSSAPPAE